MLLWTLIKIDPEYFLFSEASVSQINRISSFGRLTVCRKCRLLPCNYHATTSLEKSIVHEIKFGKLVLRNSVKSVSIAAM